MEEQQSTRNHVERKKGGLITMPFIFANEICEKIAVVGFNTNMISYLTKQLHMPLTKGANTITNFNGTASLTPLIGAFIADSYVGRFWTITVASILYQIGMISLTTSAVVPGLKPPPCKGGEICEEASGKQLGILYFSLLLTALGSGGIRPCVVSFGADQFDESDPKQGKKTYKYFNWYYFAMGASMLVAVTVLVYVQDNIGWGWGFGIPTIAMFLSIITFVLGYSIYRHLDPSGSPFTRLLQVSVAAFRKRKLEMVPNSTLLYQNHDIDDPISRDGKLLHTNHMRFLDKAAVVTEQDKVKLGEKPNLWNLNTVHRVEELKSVIRMGPIWASGIILITAYSQQYTFSLQQGTTMDRRLTDSFKIPAGSMSVFTLLTMLITIALYDRIFIPIARRFTGLDRGITFLKRMGIGLVISIFATLVAGFVERKRKHVALIHGLQDHPSSTIPISIFWLVPQYSLHGMAEAFMSIGHLEFFYDQSPESMRSTAMALFWTSISAGNYLSTLLVTLVHKYTAGPNGYNWLRNDNINKGKLENFYWLVTLLQVFNLVYYIVCAKMYTFKPLEVQRKVVDSSKVDEVQLVNPV
ncbi:protein NRT1/ PTR FAMILY 3.1 [Cucurbita pepo subsp. pepo]|uniref:protein NRT1/ PTR FAMILY 3.1 n=1 Tax=Cucurbita pepo subsp. pepo TaxID=3664 RepID=UPI000C9D2692|nr:protein NRT1/ PTR FAMILY 3.1 [Cucurbita pepo subsp. pepo]